MDTIKVTCNDNTEFEIKMEDAIKSGTLKNLIDDIGTDSIIPISTSGDLFKKILKCLTGNVDEELKVYENDSESLIDIVKTSNYLECKDILDKSCELVANMIRGKTTDQIRQSFNLVDDLSQDEKLEIEKLHTEMTQ